MLMLRERFREEYLKIIDPLDARWHYENYEPGLWVKHQIAHHVNPRIIVEIGVRSGYSAWAMIKACPTALYMGYDNYDPMYAERCGTTIYKSLSEQFETWARQLLRPPQHHVIKQDSRSVEWMPPYAELYHVDGDHKRDSAESDVRKCIIAGGAGSVIVVHDFMAKPVREACAAAAKEFDWTVHEIIEKRNGDGLIVKGEVPKWAHELETV